MATVPSLSSPPCLLHSQVAAHRDRQRCPFRSFHSAQASSNKCHSFRGKQSCAASSRCACACAQAGTHGGGRRAAAGVHPAGHRSLLVVVVALMAAARSSGPAGEKSEEMNFRGQHVVRTTAYAVRVQATGRQQGPVRILFACGSVGLDRCAGPRC